MPRLNEYGEEVYSVAEVFPEAHPGMVVRGFRTRDDMTREELAARLGITLATLAALESGSRPISISMAKRLGQTFDMPYKAFL